MAPFLFMPNHSNILTMHPPAPTWLPDITHLATVAEAPEHLIECVRRLEAATQTYQVRCCVRCCASGMGEGDQA